MRQCIKYVDNPRLLPSLKSTTSGPQVGSLPPFRELPREALKLAKISCLECAFLSARRSCTDSVPRVSSISQLYEMLFLFGRKWADLYILCYLFAV